MPIGKREKKWFRPISEFKGGEPQVQPAFPTSTPSPLPQPAIPTPLPQTQPAFPTSTPSPLPQPAIPSPLAQAQPAFPTSPQVPPMQEMDGGTIDFLSVAINTVQTNPYFIGMLMLLLNLGGRFLSMELTQKQEEFLQQRWLRPLIFFTVIFVATRNLAVAFWMTLALFLVLWILANEQSPFCLIPSWRKTGLDPHEKEARYEKNMEIIESIHANGH